MEETHSQEKRNFSGYTINKIDTQRRLLLPREWKLQSDTPLSSYFIVPAAGHDIKIYDKWTYENVFVPSLRKQITRENKQLLVYLGSLTSEVVPDKQGRFTITKELLEHGRLCAPYLEDMRIVVVGTMSHGRIISFEEWDRTMNNPPDLDSVEDALNLLDFP